MKAALHRLIRMHTNTEQTHKGRTKREAVEEQDPFAAAVSDAVFLKVGGLTGRWALL